MKTHREPLKTGNAIRGNAVSPLPWLHIVHMMVVKATNILHIGGHAGRLGGKRTHGEVNTPPHHCKNTLQLLA